MVIPITKESAWLERISDLPEWHPSKAPVLLIAPHPDDETLGAGGFIADRIAHGVDVTVLAVTDGENAYLDAEPDVLAATRRIEQTKALQRLGLSPANIIRLHLPDSDVTKHLSVLIDRLRSFVSKETHIVAPWRGDFHPDHEACGLAAETVSSETGAKLTSYFFWTWHRGTPALLDELLMGGLSLHSFPLTSSLLEAKSAALLCHQSQLSRESGDPILPNYLLAPAYRPFEVFAIS